MLIPEPFTFTQQNLQDYVDCRFRFYLKYVKHLEWPAVESEPLMLQEARMELGQQFHLLVQRYFSGIDSEALTSSITSNELISWWQVFESLNLTEVPGARYAEKTISVPINNHRLLAKFDLVVEKSARCYSIYDWKTSAHRTSSQVLRARLQSRVYPYVLRRSIERVPAPEIEMVYWFPAFPERPYQFDYSEEQFEADGTYLSNLIEEIQSQTEEDFNKTENEKSCLYCRFRSLCERGITAGTLEPGMDEDAGAGYFEIDFELS